MGFFSKSKREGTVPLKTKKPASRPISEVNSPFGGQRSPALDKHFGLLEEIRTYYKKRDQPGFLEKAIKACEMQIALAPKAAAGFKSEFGDDPLPGHTGYEQLAIIRAKQGNYEEAIRLCNEAQSSGWAGDWDARIERYQWKMQAGAEKLKSGSAEIKPTVKSPSPAPPQVSAPRHYSHRKTRQLDASEGVYVPLPASPASWEERESKNPKLAEYEQIFRTASGCNSVGKVERYRAIPPEDRTGEIAKKMLTPYRQARDAALKGGHLSVAMQWAAAMMVDVPAGVNNADRKKYNKIVDGLGEVEKEHTYEKMPLEAEEKPDLFEVTGGGWSIDNVRKLYTEEKPNTKYKGPSITAKGLLYYAPGGIDKFPAARSVIRTIGFNGEASPEVALPHDIYRMSSSPAASGFTVLSSDCSLYSYDQAGNLIYFENLSPVCNEKTHLRCIAHNASFDRLLFSAIDEAWCIDASGRDIWALEMPPQAGWEKTYERVQRYGNEQEVSDSLGVLGLSRPISSEQIKVRFRDLALQWHPDRNPDAKSHEMMIQLIDAYEVLTGLNAEAVLGPAKIEKRYRKVLSVQEVAPGISITIEMGGLGEDWIYAAAFGADGTTAFLGTYSGRILEVDERGMVRKVIDVGNTPRSIMDTGNILYIQTNTRLYALRGDKLVFIKDIFDVGDVIIGDNGFWYLASKQLQLFNNDGDEVGSLKSKDPIRAFYCAEDELIVDTRQHRAVAALF